MPELKRPGVYTEETLDATVATSSDVGVSAGAIIGAHNRGPSDVKTVTGWGPFEKLYGGLSNDFAYAAYLFFANGGSTLHCVRVPGTGAGTASRILNDRDASPQPTLTVSAANAGEWGNSVYVAITDGDTGRFNLIVHEGGAGAAFVKESWNDLSMDSTDDRYVETIINHPTAGSAYITVADQESGSVAPDNIPALQTATVLTAGADGTEATGTAVGTALSEFDSILSPFSLNLPGETDTTVLGTAITYVEGRGDAFLVIDSVAGDTPASAVSYASSIGTSSYAAVYFPRVWFSDPASTVPGAKKLLPTGGAVMGQYAQVDGRRGVHKAPAGREVTLRGATELERKLTNAELDSLNDGHVNAIRNMPGSGIVIMGARTLKKRQADKYVPVRRTLNYLAASLKDLTQFAVFEPNDEYLWELIRMSADGFLTAFWQGKGLRGTTAQQAFYVKCDAELNDAQSISEGKVNLEVGVALQRPAEFVVIRIGQWQGGSSATDVA